MPLDLFFETLNSKKYGQNYFREYSGRKLDELKLELAFIALWIFYLVLFLNFLKTLFANIKDFRNFTCNKLISKKFA